MRYRILLCGLALFISACGGLGDESLRVETEVTWTTDIQQLLADNCVRCHQSPSQNGAPTGFRFDQYQRGELDSSRDGAFEKLARIKARAVDQIPSAMPPGGTLTPGERAILNTWIENGGPREPSGGRSPRTVTQP